MLSGGQTKYLKEVLDCTADEIKLIKRNCTSDVFDPVSRANSLCPTKLPFFNNCYRTVSMWGHFLFDFYLVSPYCSLSRRTH